MTLATTTIETPLGRYALAASERGLVSAQPALGSPAASDAASAAARRVLADACAAFARYFAGEADALAALTVDPHGTDFQRRVWAALREIAPGATASYGAIAQRVGSPGAARAVGDANRRNPVAIAIPCHRVIGGNGRLVGYAGGLARKRWLLDHEAAWRQAAAPSRSIAVGDRRSPVALARSRESAAASI
jgi:methylated-DNA-[protein]-cysteine S-methyltransferase